MKKLFSLVIGILFTSFYIKAQIPAITIVAYTDESAFVNSFSSYGFKTPDQLDLNRTASTAGYKDVYGFDIPSDKVTIGFKWNQGDEETKEWRPQGITGFTWNLKRYLLVTWYAFEYGSDDPDYMRNVHNGHKGARISLINITNMSNITYRHILLVQNIENTTNRSNPELFHQYSGSHAQLAMFAPVTSHAGGVAFSAGKIYVAQTDLGFRVFDLNKIIEVESNEKEDSIGKMSNGKLKAFNYRYILPQIGYYKSHLGSPFSSAEFGEGLSSSDKILWSGTYLRPEDQQTPKVYGFPLTAAGNLNSATIRTVAVKDETSTNVYGIQGAYRSGTKTYMTITGTTKTSGESTARLVVYVDGASAGKRYRWPHGAEDLYVENYFSPVTRTTTKYLWCLTEYETEKYNKDNRCVFAVKLSDY